MIVSHFFTKIDFLIVDINLLLVFFYNFGWKDYGEASLTGLLDMVKVMAFSVSEGKVAVHCHAGKFLSI
jgi:protein tyrosine phosphatase